MPVLDHRGPEFQKLGHRVLAGIKTIFKTEQPVIIYPASGTGAWEAALANTMSPGDKVLMYETGHFAFLWQGLAEKLGLEPEFIAGDWRGGVDAAKIEERLRPMPATRSRRCASSTTRRRPGRPRTSTRCALRSMRPATRRC